MTYSTNCKCKRHQFKTFKEAREHLESCSAATVVYYDGPYDKVVAFSK
jgi:hypothetical protein